MKQKVFAALWGASLGFCLSFAVVGGLTTAFSMEVSLGTLSLLCLVASVSSAVCYSLPLGLVMPGVLAFGLGYFYHTGDLVRSVEALLYRLSQQYHGSYGWPIIRWTGRLAEQMEQTLPLVLCLLGVAVAVLICRSICRGKSAAPGVILALVGIAPCFVTSETVPGSVFLYLLFLSLITLLITSGVRSRNMEQGNRLTAVAVPATVLCLAVLFLAVPRAEYSAETAEQLEVWLAQNILGQSQQEEKDVSTVDLTQMGYRTVGQNKVLDVKADYTGQLYLRGQALDHYDGVTWSESDNTEIGQLNWPKDLPKAGVVELTSKYAHSQLYVPYYAASQGMRESQSGVKNSQRLTKYSFSTWKTPTKADLQAYQADSGAMSYYMLSAISLPESVKKWAEPIAREITGNTGNVYEAAQLIAQYVRACASYDTQTPRMGRTEKDFARWFLQKSDTGYCVHFATATTVLLQAAGIPARYVSGYVAQAVAGQTVEVTADMAHAWCEYWLPGFGWLVLESTPPDLRPEPTLPLPETKPQANQPEKPRQATEFAGLWPVALLGLILVAWGQYALRLVLRKRALFKGKTNDSALARWQYGVLLAKHLQEAPNQVLQDLAEKAMFSQHTLTEEELSLFDTYLVGAVMELKKRNVFLQLYFRLVLALY